MTHTLLRRKALILRRQRKSYNQIKSILGVGKSTLSIWLRDSPLTKEEINALRGRSEIRIEKFRETMRRKQEMKIDKYRSEEARSLLPLSHKDY